MKLSTWAQNLASHTAKVRSAEMAQDLRIAEIVRAEIAAGAAG